MIAFAWAHFWIAALVAFGTSLVVSLVLLVLIRKRP
jgi:hypothetical protein